MAVVEELVELELVLTGSVGDNYALTLRLSRPGAPDAMAPAYPVTLVPAEFTALAHDIKAMGTLLGVQLFARQETLAFLAQARALAEGAGQRLRVRLLLGAGAEHLHALPWEALRDPVGSHLLFGERVLFSRFIPSPDLRSPDRRTKDRRALVAVAGPRDYALWRLDRIDVETETVRARHALRDLAAVAVLDGPVTRDRLITALGKSYDVVYLMAHGQIVEGEPVLYLQDERGDTAPLEAAELVAAIDGLPQLPRLAVLASCQSAHDGRPVGASAAALTVLGPQLAAAGVGAVVAMQGNLTIATAQVLFPTFFTTLARTGSVDEAMAVARNLVREQPDTWVPVLLMRLRDGRLWAAGTSCATLQEQLKETMTLLHKYEGARLTATLPETALGAQRQVAALRRRRAELERELGELGCTGEVR